MLKHHTALFIEETEIQNLQLTLYVYSHHFIFGLLFSFFLLFFPVGVEWLRRSVQTSLSMATASPGRSPHVVKPAV